ncbi:MAG: hypothetical protein JW793_01450 [Acidobacteria bacterium]|nr:hypothetical protein [Acidobacteriota bacterium]
MEVPNAVLQAQEASLDELLHIVNRYGEIRTLKANRLKAEYTSEKEKGSLVELEKYPKAPGFILLERPDSLLMAIQAPVLRKREISLLSVGDEFRVWIHGKSLFYIGENSSKELISDELEENPEIPIRAGHIIEAILPEPIPLDNPAIRFEKTEEEDSQAKYYVLRVSRLDSSPRIRPLREFKIERAGLTISSQRTFDEEGRVLGDIAYTEPVQIDRFPLPEKIHIERPQDGYTLDLEFSDWSVNPDFKDDTFSLEPVSGVKVIRFK